VSEVGDVRQLNGLVGCSGAGEINSTWYRKQRQSTRGQAGRSCSKVQVIQGEGWFSLTRSIDLTLSKHHVEVNSLKATNKELQRSLDAQSKASTSTAELRKAHALAEAENARLRRELEGIRSKAEYAGEVKREIEQVRQENQVMQLRIDDTDELKAKNERLEEMLDTVAMVCHRLHLNTVGKARYHTLQEQLRDRRNMRLAAENRAVRLDYALRSAREENQDLREKLSLAEGQRMMAEHMVDALIGERRAYQEAGSTGRFSTDNSASLDIFPSEALRIIDLALSHSTFAASHLRAQLDALMEDHHEVLASLANTSATLDTAQTNLSTLKSQHAHLEDLFSARETAHSPCDELITDLRRNFSRAVTSQVETKRSLDEVRMELRRVEEKARVDREALKRANDGAMRWKSAETALEEEITM